MKSVHIAVPSRCRIPACLRFGVLRTSLWPPISHPSPTPVWQCNSVTASLYFCCTSVKSSHSHHAHSSNTPVVIWTPSYKPQLPQTENTEPHGPSPNSQTKAILQGNIGALIIRAGACSILYYNYIIIRNPQNSTGNLGPHIKAWASGLAVGLLHEELHGLVHVAIAVVQGLCNFGAPVGE